MLPQESASLHGMLHASRQWLGEVSQSSAMLAGVLPQTSFSKMYAGNANLDVMHTTFHTTTHSLVKTSMWIHLPIFALMQRLKGGGPGAQRILWRGS